jgi:replicative DNA helicase
MDMTKIADENAAMTDGQLAERSYVSTVLLYPDRLYEVAVPVHQISHPRLRAVYQAILDLRTEGDEVNALTVESRLDGKYGIDATYMIELDSSAVPAASMKAHARVIQENWLGREVRKLCSEVRGSKSDGHELMSEIQAGVSRLASAMTVTQSSTTTKLGDVAMQITRECDARRSGAQPTGIMRTGIDRFDRYLTLRLGNVMIVGARPSIGKTAFMEWLFDRLLAQGERVIMFTTESTKAELATRYTGRLADVNTLAIQKGNVNDGRIRAMYESSEALCDEPIWINDDVFEIDDVVRETMRMRAEHGVTVLIIDYLQELTDSRGDSRKEHLIIKSILTKLRVLVKSEPRMYCIVASQIGRKAENRESKRPALSDLKESGKIEDMAHAVLLLHRAWFYDRKNADPSLLEVLWAKNKNGPVGLMHFDWDNDRGKVMGPVIRSSRSDDEF